MLSEDAHRQKLRELAASIRAWSGFIADVARVEIVDDPPVWRVAIEPHASRACPIEMQIDSRMPVCDLTIGTETYEGWKLPSMNAVLPLIVAVSEGEVVTRKASSAATGARVGVSTLVTLPDGSRIDLSTGQSAADIARDGIEIRDMHYVCYRKPGRTA